MAEIWKDISGYEGYYQVSNQGRVRSLDRTIPHNLFPGKTRKLCGHIMKTNSKDEYVSVSLCKDGCVYSAVVHRLVATAFIPNPENKPQVNHIDGNKHNNAVENLEWVTDVENKHHAIETGLNDKSSWFTSERAKEEGEKWNVLQRKPVRCIETSEEFPSIKACAQHFNITSSTISEKLKYNKPWKGLHFELINKEESENG